MTVEGNGGSKVFIIEEHPIVSTALGRLIALQPDLSVAGLSKSIPSAETFLPEPPDLIVMDMSVGSSNGFELLADLRRLGCDVPVLFFSIHSEDLYALRAMAEGARGYLMKTEDPATIVEAIRTVIRGDIYLSGRMRNQFIRLRTQARSAEQLAPETLLSPREKQVFDLVGQGLTSPEIAANLGITIKTVQDFRLRIRDKLNLRGSDDLVRMARAWQVGH